MKPLGGGDFSLATPPATTTTTNHLLGGRNPYLVLFWQKCLITEWFSWLIIKTALDRNQRVVTTNTCVFSLTGLTLTHLITNTQQTRKSSIISLKKMLVAPRCTTSPSSQVVMLFTHTHIISYALVNIYIFNPITKPNKNRKRKRIKMTRNMVSLL